MIRQAARACVRRAAVAKPLNIAMPHLCSSLRPSIALFQSQPSASPRLFSSTSDALSDLLAREHAEEMANDTTTMPETLKHLKEKLQADWKIVDSGSAITKLYKTVGALKVQVSFHCQDATERLNDQFPEEEDSAEEVEHEEQPPSVRFTVSANKAGKSVVMICVSEDAVARIQNALVVDTDVDPLHTDGIDESIYQGPEFSELAEDLQDAFQGFLEEDVGVNNDVAAFITMYFDYKEQCQYVKFLEDAKSILS